MIYVTCDANSGEIKSTLRGTFNEVLQTCHLMGLGYDPIEVDREPNPDTEYVVGRRLVDRPTMSLVLSGRVLGGIPPGSTLTCGGVTHENVGGEVELEFNTPGPHLVVVSCSPYLPQSLEVL